MLKIKILPLILILCLTFTLIGDCAWLGSEGEWDYRIELAINDYAGKINGSVTWFPVDVFLTVTQAEEVFAELTSDAEYKKIQFTQADGTSLLYGHMKVFDVSETKGIFTVSATGWTIDGNTSIFLYYDSTHIDNDTYIGATNTAACENVYNPQYIAVYTMADGVDNANIYDATSNNNDGTKTSAGNPAEVTGKVGQAQDFSSDYITFGDNLGFERTDPFTVEAIVKLDSVSGNQLVVTKAESAGDYIGWMFFISDAKIDLILRHDTSPTIALEVKTTVTLNTGTYYTIASTYDGSSDPSGLLHYLDGALEGKDAATHDTLNDSILNAVNLNIGGRNDTASFDGIIDEVRVSNVVRSAAWEKGFHSSSWDTLFTYGSEETAPVVEAAANIMFMFSAF